MAYSESEARALVIEAGHRLVSSGLIARTWGNISARISDTQFVITPSGRSYDDLRPEELVRVNIADCSYDGEIKPSSEKGIHADGYALRPDVDFIIHTHQFYATAVGAAGEPVGHPAIPCAAYGIPSTKKLRRSVAKAVAENPGSDAILMTRHGALCLGKTFEDAFRIASELEEKCEKAYRRKTVPVPPPACADLGSSERHGDSFVLTLGETSIEYPVCENLSNAPLAAKLHAALYAAEDITGIVHCADGEAVEISAKVKTLYPVIDDLAQIAGVSVRCVKAVPEKLAGAVKGRNAVLIRGCGALCTGVSEGDAQAVSMILRKDCAAARYLGSLRGLSFADAALQRLIYVKKYSKQKDGK